MSAASSRREKGTGGVCAGTLSTPPAQQYTRYNLPPVCLQHHWCQLPGQTLKHKPPSPKAPALSNLHNLLHPHPCPFPCPASPPAAPAPVPFPPLPCLPCPPLPAPPPPPRLTTSGSSTPSSGSFRALLAMTWKPRTAGSRVTSLRSRSSSTPRVAGTWRVQMRQG